MLLATAALLMDGNLSTIADAVNLFLRMNC